MRPLPPGYNPGRPRPRPIVGSGITGPRPGMSTPFGPRPGVQQPRAGTLENIAQIYKPGMQQPIPRDPGYGNGYSQYGPRGFGPMQGQGVGDPRLGAATIPGNQAQMQMRGPTQAAPVQPVPAMKKGGAVRGVRIALRGAKKATIY